MCRHLPKAIGIIKNQENMTPPRDSKTLVTSLKEIEIQDFAKNSK